MSSVVAQKASTKKTPSLTDTIVSKLKAPETSSKFDFDDELERVLSYVGLTAADSGGKVSFYGADPIIPSRFRFGTTAALTLAAKSVAAAAIWKDRTGEGQDISVDVRKAVRRFAGFFEGKWETINGREPRPGEFAGSPFFTLPMFRPTADGRHVVCLNFYHGMRARTLTLLRCGESNEAISCPLRRARRAGRRPRE